MSIHVFDSQYKWVQTRPTIESLMKETASVGPPERAAVAAATLKNAQQHCVCSICLCVPERLADIVQLGCTHLFCRSCIALVTGPATTCPVCRRAFDKNVDVVPALVVRNMLGDVLVAGGCRNAGCRWQGPVHPVPVLKSFLDVINVLNQVLDPPGAPASTVLTLADLDSHHAVCPFVPMRCAAGTCDFVTPRCNEVAARSHLLTCPDRCHPCVHRCGKSVANSQTVRHRLLHCPPAIMDHCTEGCGTPYTSAQAYIHLQIPCTCGKMVRMCGWVAHVTACDDDAPHTCVHEALLWRLVAQHVHYFRKTSHSVVTESTTTEEFLRIMQNTVAVRMARMMPSVLHLLAHSAVALAETPPDVSATTTERVMTPTARMLRHVAKRTIDLAFANESRDRPVRRRLQAG
jgi:hypothetical protein